MFRIHRNKKSEIIKGSKYTVTNTIESVDVDGDEVIDLRVTHLTKRDGEAFYESQSVWYGIDAKLANEFISTLKPLVMTDIPMKNFGALVKHWKQLAKTLEKITEFGLSIAKKIGEV